MVSGPDRCFGWIFAQLSSWVLRRLSCGVPLTITPRRHILLLWGLHGIPSLPFLFPGLPRLLSSLDFQRFIPQTLSVRFQCPQGQNLTELQVGSVLWFLCVAHMWSMGTLIYPTNSRITDRFFTFIYYNN